MNQAHPFFDFPSQLPPQVIDQLEAYAFAERNLPERSAVRDYYEARRQNIREAVQLGKRVPEEPDLPRWTAGEHNLQKSFRFALFLLRQINRHAEKGRLTLSVAHALESQARERLVAVRRKLHKEGLPEPVQFLQPVEDSLPSERGAKGEGPTAELPTAIPVQPAVAVPAKPAAPRRSVLEVLLDPRSIQWFLAAGGGLFVVGLVVLLWALKIFENKIVVASFLGAGTLAIVFGGWAILAWTRFQFAGRAVTLLGCLVLPLNLWYYYADCGMEEQLWLPALACCVIYAASAWRLKDVMFVPVLVGGVALTGLLILSDMNQFKEVAAPATMLVLLGLVCIHAERSFIEGESPFSRQRFGLMFFWSGHAVLGAGLLLLLGGQLVAVFHPMVAWIPGLEIPPEVATVVPLKWLALALVVLGTYAYLYSDLVVRRLGVYTWVAAFTLIWAEVLLLNLLGLIGLELLIAALAITGLAVNLLQRTFKEKPDFIRTLPVLGLLPNLLAVALSLVLHVSVLTPNHGLAALPTRVTWTSVVALVLVAVSCRVGAFLWHDAPRRETGDAERRITLGLESTYFFATAAATLMAAAELLMLLGIKNWSSQVVWLMLIPIAYIVAARQYRGHSAELPLVYCGHVATALMVASTTLLLFHPEARAQKPAPDHLLAVFCAEASLFYALNAGWRQRAFNVYLSTLLGSAAVWFVLHSFGVAYVEFYTLVFAGLGFVLLIAYRLALVERVDPKMEIAAFQCGNALLSLALLAGVLQTLNQHLFRLGFVPWNMVWYSAGLGGLALAAAFLVVQTHWRRWYQALAVAAAALTVYLLYRALQLEPWRTVELFCIGLGVLLLIASHIGWSREGDNPNEQVSFGLFLGSLLVALPLVVAVLIYRFRYAFLTGTEYGPSVGDEIALVTIGLVLFGSGYMLKLRSTTLVGATMVVGYLLILLAYVQYYHMSWMWIMGLYLTLGGLLLFGIGLLLSVYRDRLLELPEKIRRREGIFRVLSWR